ncbi:hypothetical protein K1719_024107 [Acacia pycnantha]|nr:hypothetical protein K1719_024107 [Acacia pycnantha]
MPMLDKNWIFEEQVMRYVARNGFHILGAHTDSPCLKLKPVTKVVKGGYLEVGVQTYGGQLWYTWFDRDLTVAGMVILRQEKEGSTSYLHRLVRIEEPIMRIPTLAIHLDRDVNNGFKPNTQSHLVPILATLVKAEFNKAAADNDSIENGPQNDGKKENDKTGSKNAKHHSLLLQLLASELGCEPDDICDFELQACDSQPSIVAGAAKEFIFSGRLDNLCSSFCSLKKVVSSKNALAERLKSAESGPKRFTTKFVLLSLSVPSLYDKYQDHIDDKLYMIHWKIRTLCGKLDSNPLRKILLPSNKAKKME